MTHSTSMLCSRMQHTRPSSSLPTPCITNAVIIPLPTWIYLLVLAALLILRLQRPKSSSAGAKTAPTTAPTAKSESEPEGSSKQQARHRSYSQRTLSGIYYFLIVATLAMVSLEIARLVASGQGFGLLPFTLAGTVCAGFSRWQSGRQGRGGGWAALRESPGLARAEGWARVGWWAGLAVMYAVGTAVAAGGLRRGARGFEGAFIDGDYPLADQVTDRAVIVGVAVVQAGLEGWRMVMMTRVA